MLDTHCHITYPPLCDRVEDVLAKARARGVDRVITVGTTPEDAQRAVALAERHEGVFATVGLHPHHAHEWDDKALALGALRALASHERVVALGEMGLDRHYPDPPIADQKRALGWQLELAAEFPHLPIIIHNRQATDETLTALGAAGFPGSRYVFHCFTGSRGELDAILAFGAMVSFTGIVTFKNSLSLAEASDAVPIDRLMVETDSPYLTPEPHRKVKPNEPCYAADVAAFLAQRRGMNVREFTDRVDGNAERFFARVCAGGPGGN